MNKIPNKFVQLRGSIIIDIGIDDCGDEEAQIIAAKTILKRKLESIEVKGHQIIDESFVEVEINDQKSKCLKMVGMQNIDGELVYASECNSQIEGSDYDGPVLWPTMEAAKEILDEFGGLPENEKLVNITLTIE